MAIHKTNKRCTSHVVESCAGIFLLLALLLTTPLHAENFKAYLKHSSGMVMGNNGAGRAVLLSQDSKDVVQMQFIETVDGWYNIKLTSGTGAGQFLSKVNSWNAAFVTTATTDDTKFKIEGDREGLVKLLCKSNNRYMGTDNNDAGTNVYSDKDGTDVKHRWFITSDLAAEPDLSTVRFEINPSDLRQLNEGWGVSLCWWANMCGKWSDKKIDEIIDWLVSPTGLNYNIFRYNIGGGDDPNNTNCTPHHMGGGKGLRAEMEGFKDSSDDEYHWERDAAQRKIMLKIKEKRPDAIFEAFSNTPPWYMTYSGCCSGNTDGGKDNLKPEYYEEFAHYLVDVCKHYKDEYGIEFRSLEPFNEATTSYWYCSGVQEGCHFDYDSQIKFIKVLYPILKKSGLNTFISAADETAVWPAIIGFNEYQKAGIMNMIGQWNTHTYYGNNADRKNFNQLVRATGKRLWMSETGSGGNGLSGNLSMAQRLMDDVRYIAPDAWVDWQYFEEKNDQWCTVQGSFADQTYKKVKNYYVRQHFSRFIRQGYTYLNVENEQTLAAISSGKDTLVFVVLNTQPSAVEHVVTLKDVKANGDIMVYQTDESHNLARYAKAMTISDNGTLSFKLPSNSIRTFVIPMHNGNIDNVQAAKPATLVSCRTSDGTLHITAAGGTDVKVYSTSGAMLHHAIGSTNVALPTGVYLINATSGNERQTITIKI